MFCCQLTNGTKVIFLFTASQCQRFPLGLHMLTLLIVSSQFTWARNPNWSSFYSSAEEIWQYLKDTTTKYDLEKYMKFNHTVKAVRWDEVEGVWDLEVQIQDGSVFHDRCEILADGSGILR